MNKMNTKPNLLMQMMLKKSAQQKDGRNIGVIANKDISRQFGTGEKPLLKPSRGGRNGNGKP